MTGEVEFMSDEWVSALERVAQRLLDPSVETPAPDFTYIEWFTDAPAFRPDGKRVGYVMTVESGKVTVRSGIDDSDQADCTVQMDYADAVATMAVSSGPGLDELGGRAFASGTLIMTGSMGGMPVPMNALHDEMCRATRVD